MSAHLSLGYDYVRAIGELLEKFTYQEIATRIGYRSVGSITSILKGKVPSHLHGEALWLLYKQTFDRRPPLVDAQRIANSLTE